MRVRRTPRGAMARAALPVLVALAMCSQVRADVIDRILAVVGGELITLSDVTAAVKLGLVPAPRAGGDVVRVALDALISRQLELAEANRYQPPEPAQADVQARFDEVRRRGGTAEALAATLAQAGLSEEQLRLRVRDDLRIEAFLAQRFGGARQPSEPEVLDYYRAHQPEFTTAAGIRPLSDVRDTIRATLTTSQRATLLNDWLEGLRRRTEIADLYVAAK